MPPAAPRCRSAGSTRPCPARPRKPHAPAARRLFCRAGRPGAGPLLPPPPAAGADPAGRGGLPGNRLPGLLRRPARPAGCPGKPAGRGGAPARSCRCLQPALPPAGCLPASIWTRPSAALGCVVMASGLGRRFGGQQAAGALRRRRPLLQPGRWTPPRGVFARRVVVTRHRRDRRCHLPPAAACRALLHGRAGPQRYRPPGP